MSLVKAVADRLKTAPAPWVDVKTLDGLTQLDLKKSGARTPTLYVFPVGETAGRDIRGSGPYLQTMTVTVGVVLVDKSRNGHEIDFEPLRKELKKRLFGWEPLSDHEPFWLGGGKLLSLQSGMASWLDNFVTEYTEDQNAYGS